MSLVSASRLTTVEKLIFTSDLVNSKSFNEARVIKAFSLMRFAALYRKIVVLRQNFWGEQHFFCLSPDILYIYYLTVSLKSTEPS